MPGRNLLLVSRPMLPARLRLCSLPVAAAALAALSLSTLLTTAASAEGTLLANWLWNGVAVAGSLSVETSISLTFEDTKTFGGAAAVLCLAILDGSVNANGEGEMTELLNPKGEKIGGLGGLALLGTGEGSECKAVKACAEGSTATPIEVTPLGLPWRTLLFQHETTGTFLLLLSTAGELGYEALCLVLGINSEDKCTSTGKDFEIEVANQEEAAAIPASAQIEPFLNCTQGGEASGKNKEDELTFIKALVGGKLSVASEGGGGGGGAEPTTLTTTLSGEGKEGEKITILEGSKVKDKAKLEGKNASSATGKVVYKVYSESACKTLVATAGEVSVSGESVPVSSEEELEGGASYYWQAHYTGDSKNTESTSACTEISTVKAKTSLTTKLSGESKEGEELTVLEGSKAKDKATLTGTKSSTAEGKAVYKIYSDSECKTLYKEAGEVTVGSGSVPASNEEELAGGKTYYWQATYKGDGLHQESTSACSEVLKVKAKTTVATTLIGESKEGAELTVLEGATVKDKATVKGTNSSSAEGKVIYKVYFDSECKELAAEAGEMTVSGGSAAASNEEELGSDKIYYWQATYKGDSLHQESTSACGSEVLTVKAKTTLSTILSGEGKEGAELTVLEGATVKDKATLAGTGSSSAGGKVLYKVYSDSKCTELVVEAGEKTVSSGSVPASNEEPLSPGTYYWQASYSGDSLHAPSTSSCGTEISIVKGKTTLTTSLSGEGHSGPEIAAAELEPVVDHATVGGALAPEAEGTMFYGVYSDAECKHLVAEAGEASVSSGVAGPSDEQALPEGTYYWKASYSGDAHNQPSSTCGSEVLIVKAATAIETTLSGESHSGPEIEVAEGSPVTDGATLVGEDAFMATGTVKYDVYSDSECKHLVAEAGEVAVAGTSVPASNEESLESGTYYWQATYSGDTDDGPSVSACGSEILVVKTTTSLTTTLSSGGKTGTELDVDENAGVADTATLSGTNASTATGTVTYSVYSDSECKTLIAESESAVTAGSVAESEEQSLPPGKYYWKAYYSGDEGNLPSTSSCGSETVLVKSETSVRTTALEGELEKLEVIEGTAVNDTATLSGANASTATGTAKYDVYSDSECKTPAAEAGEVTVSGTGIPTSEAVALPVGTYYWQVVYSGDSSNQGSKSECGTSIEIVKSPLATSLSGEGLSGAEISVVAETPTTDVATFLGEGYGTATGTVEYNVYSDSECKTLAAEAGEVAVTAGSVPPSNEVKLKAGTYYWQATYSGDESHPSSTSECGIEIEKVVEPLTTSLSSEGQVGTEVEALDESAVTDTATLNGVAASTATGTVSYDVYSDSECKHLVAEAGEVAVIGASVPASNEEALAPGTYYWQADYSGDEHHAAVTSACGTEIETVNEPLTTELSAEGKSAKKVEVKEESVPAHDTAVLNGAGASTATGTVKYKVYSDNECKTLATEAGEVAVTAGSIPSSTEVKLKPGTYYWQADYSGDEHHAAVTSACGTEIEKVIAPWIVSLGDSFISGEGGRWAGNVSNNSETSKTDALGAEAYFGLPNEEFGAEAIPFCHRSKAAEIFIGGPVRSKNLACSNAATYTFVEPRSDSFKPGIDFEDKLLGQKLETTVGEEPCPIARCVGQALQLEEFAKTHRVRMVNVSIGGNNFNFADIVKNCVMDFFLGSKTMELRINTAAAEVEAFAAAVPGPEWLKARIVAVAKTFAEQLRAGAALIGPRYCSKEAGVTATIEREAAWQAKTPAQKAARRAEERANPALRKEGAIALRIQRAIENVGVAMAGAGYARNEYSIVVQNYESLLPEGEPAAGPPPAEGFRYSEELFTRQFTGGCGFRNEDANWANKAALPTINAAVKEAAEAAAGRFEVKLMDLSKAFDGHRLCELGLGTLSEVGLAKWNETETEGANKTEWINQIRLESVALKEVELAAAFVLSKTAPMLRLIRGAEALVERIPFAGKALAEALLAPVRLAVTSVNTLALAAKGWAEGQVATTGVSPFEGLHPNYWAQLALRNCVRQAYANGAPKGGICTIEGPGLTVPGVGGIPLGGLREPKMMLK
jgi:hypothetical protein